MCPEPSKGGRLKEAEEVAGGVDDGEAAAVLRGEELECRLDRRRVSCPDRGESLDTESCEAV